MKQSAFNPKQQEKDISSKIVNGLERISEVFKKLLWEKAKLIGLSPIQIQILIFIAFHKRELSNVSHLAKEFNVTKPTVSDAIRVLYEKGFVEKIFSASDNRRYALALSDAGSEIVAQTYDYAQPLKKQVNSLPASKLEDLFTTLSKVIYQLNQNGILQVQRTCLTCKYYTKKNKQHYCNLIGSNLRDSEIRIDCLEYEEKT